MGLENGFWLCSLVCSQLQFALSFPHLGVIPPRGLTMPLIVYLHSSGIWCTLGVRESVLSGITFFTATLHQWATYNGTPHRTLKSVLLVHTSHYPVWCSKPAILERPQMIPSFSAGNVLLLSWLAHCRVLESGPDFLIVLFGSFTSNMCDGRRCWRRHAGWQLCFLNLFPRPSGCSF